MKYNIIVQKSAEKFLRKQNMTANGRKKCAALAAEWAVRKERENILSPCTIMDYTATRRNYVQQLMTIRIDDLSQQHIQQAINMGSTHLSPKTIRNIHGLISAVVKIYRPDFALNTALPQKRRT